MAKRPYRMTETRIARLLKEGRGAGAGRDYKPWYTIQDVPSHGRSTRIRGAVTGREHHLLSDIETGMFLECDRAEGVLDLREQYPLPREKTRAIAAQAGIRHPADHGVDVVVTTDLLVDIMCSGSRKLIALSAKPAKLLDSDRTIEKLEIERRFWAGAGVNFRIVTEREVSKVVVKNLRWLHEWRWLEGIDPPASGSWDGRAAVVLAALLASQCNSVKSFFCEVERSSGWEAGAALSAVRRLAAIGAVVIDLTREFDRDGPLSQLRIPEGQIGSVEDVLAA